MTEQASAGWYPDPSGRYPMRYFDGAGWTAHVCTREGTQSTDPEGTAPTRAPPPTTPGPESKSMQASLGWIRATWESAGWDIRLSFLVAVLAVAVLFVASREPGGERSAAPAATSVDPIPSYVPTQAERCWATLIGAFSDSFNGTYYDIASARATLSATGAPWPFWLEDIYREANLINGTRSAYLDAGRPVPERFQVDELSAAFDAILERCEDTADDLGF